MNKKPRIAFCFSGQARTLDQTYLFFQKNLFDAAKEQGFDYDVFCAVEDDDDVDKVKLLNPTKIEKIKSSHVEKIIKKKWGANYVKDLFGEYVFPYSYTQSMYYSNLLQQLYKVSKSILLVKNNGHKYDIIVKLRFDFIFLNKINFLKIYELISEKGGVLCNTARGFIRGQFMKRKIMIINDFFFFGSMSSMGLLGKIFDDFKSGLIGQECKLKFIRNIFSGWKNLIIAINNKLFNRWILPSQPLEYIEVLMYRIWSTEALYYYYFINNGIDVELNNFSRILLRKNNYESIINVVDKSLYEL